MNEELRNYIEELFADAPKTRGSYELKEELMANSMERYLDLVENKVPEKEAMDIVINSIGDINQLFAAEEGKNEGVPISAGALKTKALFRSAAVGLYILGFCAMVLFIEFTSLDILGFVVMMLFTAAATCILVYAGSAYPKYSRCDDTVVEEFKEWNSGQKKRKAIRKSVDTIVWMVVLILYFLISFTTMAWNITWIIFLIGACAQAIVNLLFELKD